MRTLSLLGMMMSTVLKYGNNTANPIMKFTYDKEKEIIYSDDPTVRVERSGSFRGGPEQFLLVFNGKRIGFSEPESPREMVKVELNKPYTYTIGSIGEDVTTEHYEGNEHKRVKHAVPCKFASEEEQRQAVAIIKGALQACIDHPDFPPRVAFTARLLNALDSGELIHGD